MKKILLVVSFLPVLTFASAINKGESSGLFAKKHKKAEIASGSQVLRLLNMEDYIYLNDPDAGYDEPDLVDQFVEYAKEFGYENVEVVYDTTDTNETLFSELQTGKAFYDLVCPSEYMIQRLIGDNLLYKLSDEDKERIPNYFGEESYASVEIAGRLGNIQTPNGEFLRNYAVGYMWGTLGILFNPEYNDHYINDLDPISDMQCWDSLWNPDYKGTISIKDSMRDTYAAGVMYTYGTHENGTGELEDLRNAYLETGDVGTYQSSLAEIFNRCDQDSINEVKASLNKLKENIFGLEVDSGKQDIVTGKIGINLAWSGDAVYSMDQAEDEEQVSNPFELYYAIPELGSNLWFDAWVMPNCARSDAQKDLALLFLNFLSDPDIAAKNMDYTGYTSFIGGDAVLDLVNDWYGSEEENPEEDAIPVDLTYFFGGTVSEDYYDENERVIVYTDEYYADEENGNISVGRQFFTQYPDEETIARCSVMKDYGASNKLIMKMWEDFKSDPLPIWAICLFAIEIGVIGGAFFFYFFNKKVAHSLRKKRKEQNL